MSHRIGVRFRDDINDALRATARKHDRSINWIVQAAVVEWLAAQREPIQEATQSASSMHGAPLPPTLSAPREHLEAIAASGK